jgi:hypothetical protein
LKLGRQFINLDNKRFVGAVNRRQTSQTFDAAKVDFKGNTLPLKLKLTLAYICDRQGVTSSLTLKFAKYNADNEAKAVGTGIKDVTKAWVMLTYRFRTSS